MIRLVKILSIAQPFSWSGVAPPSGKGSDGRLDFLNKEFARRERLLDLARERERMDREDEEILLLR